MEKKIVEKVLKELIKNTKDIPTYIGETKTTIRAIDIIEIAMFAKDKYNIDLKL